MYIMLLFSFCAFFADFYFLTGGHTASAILCANIDAERLFVSISLWIFFACFYYVY